MSGRNYSHYQLDSVKDIDRRRGGEGETREKKKEGSQLESDVFINKFINDASGTAFSIGRERLYNYSDEL